MIVQAERLLLRPWREGDKAAFRAMGADPRVMEFFPAVLSAEESDALADRFAADVARQGWGRWAVEIPGEAAFAGMVGLNHSVGVVAGPPCVEVAWRLAPAQWGRGYAAEAAGAAMDFGFHALGLAEIVAFTALPNLRSQAVMRRLGMTPDGEFDHPALPEGHWLRRHALYRKKAP